jgi:membrane protein
MTVSARARRALWRRSTRTGYLAKRIYQEILDDNVFGLSAQLAFYFLLSLFPFLLLLSTLIPYFSPRPDLLDDLMSLIAPVVPADVMDLVYENLRTLMEDRRGGLLSFSVIILLWSSSNAFAAIIEGLNVAYEVKESRPFWKARLMAIGLTLLFFVLILTSVTLLVFGGMLARWAAENLAFPLRFWGFIRWGLSAAFLLLAFDLIYYFAPNVRHPWRWVSPGALLAIPLWFGMSLGFSYYLSRFGQYEAYYGALAAIIVLLFWFYLSAMILLIGGELNSILERELLQEAQPVTPEPPKTEADHRVA